MGAKVARLRSGQSLLRLAALVHLAAVAASVEVVRGVILNKVLAVEVVAVATLLDQISSAAVEEPAEDLVEMEAMAAAMAAAVVLLKSLEQVLLPAEAAADTRVMALMEELALVSS